MQQTAVEWLEETAKKRLEENGHETAYWHYKRLIEDFEQAKEMEKQQIIDAHINGQSEYDKGAYRKEVEDNSEYYYNETFNK